MAQKSIAELWARGVNEKINPPQPNAQTTPVKPVKDSETESKKSRFRQAILANGNKVQENING